MSLLKQLLLELPIVLPDSYLGKAPSYLGFPAITYNVIGSNTVRCPSFTSNSETFNIQLSYFDDSTDCDELIDIQEEYQDYMTNSINLSSNSFIEVKKVGSIGPRYITQEKYWQIIDTYTVTLAEDKNEEVIVEPPEEIEYVNALEYTWTDGTVTANEGLLEQPPTNIYPIYVTETSSPYVTGNWSFGIESINYTDEINPSRWMGILGTDRPGYVKMASDLERGVYDQGWGAWAEGYFYSRSVSVPLSAIS